MSESEFKLLDLAEASWARESAPEGYDWVALSMGFQPRALICHLCAALIGMPEPHTAWHKALERHAEV